MARGNICSQTKNYVVKFGPRMETMKEIIEADTDPMNEVLRLRATFLPHPLNKLCCKIWAKEIIEADTVPK